MPERDIAVILQRIDDLADTVREAAAARERAETRLWERFGQVDERITRVELAAHANTVRLSQTGKRSEAVFAAIVAAVASAIMTGIAALVLRGMQE